VLKFTVFACCNLSFFWSCLWFLPFSLFRFSGLVCGFFPFFVAVVTSIFNRPPVGVDMSSFDVKTGGVVVSLAKGLILKQIVDGIQELVDGVNFEFSRGGLRMESMDKAHVALIIMVLRRSAFETFILPKPATIGLKLESLATVMKCLGKNDSITIETKNSELVTVKFENPDASKLSVFDLKLWVIDSEELSVAVYDFDAVVRMPSTVFRRLCADLLLIGDTVSISVGRKLVGFRVLGDMSNAHLIRKASQDIGIEHNNDVEQTFSVKYLQIFAKLSAICATVSLSLGDGVGVFFLFFFSC